MKLISVEMFGNPCIIPRVNFPYEDIGDKNKKPFIALKAAALKIIYEDKKKKHYSVTLTNECNYIYDGASIPFGIGKGNMKLLVPSMWHDIMCENKNKINYERNLSSLIFRELLVQCGVNKCMAQTMYLAVDNYQRFIKEWRVKKKYE